MANYIAFLRGINVGGQKIITMERLRQQFSSMGFTNVSSYIQSGNILFSSPETNRQLLTSTIEQNLSNAFGFYISTIIRTIDELNAILSDTAFSNCDKETTKQYIAFFQEEPKKPLSIPFFSPTKDLEVVKITRTEAYIVSHLVKGRYGFPNNFLEKELEIVATTRNWNTLDKIIK